MRTEHLLTNTTRGLVTSQVMRIDQPSILTSGLYHCKVATFTTEEITSHSLLIFGELVVDRKNNIDRAAKLFTVLS